ncbi:MAG: hypothetical protein HC932_05965 [Thermales bacterium]|nr:hypothetical protein [Thermales bacterium]
MRRQSCNLQKWRRNLELVCHQCQSYYSYPTQCENCGENGISSFIGGIDKLAQEIKTITDVEPTRLDNKRLKPDFSKKDHPFVTTRVYDPAIDYSVMSKVILIAADNLLSSPDYMVQEETVKNLTELIMATTEKTKLIFDTKDLDNEFFTKIINICNQPNATYKDVLQWYMEFLSIESKIRNKFGFPPYKNLILITSQLKNRQKSIDNINDFKRILDRYRLEKFPEISVSSSYPARFLRRKNHYSYHLLIKYPKQYKDFFNLRNVIKNEASRIGLQVRLNPKNLF